MRAILNNDIIVSLVMNDTAGVEIGDIPKDIGIERLRFDGVQVVDLADLSAFWVESVLGGFVLHCIQVPSSQYIEMSYPDRKYLISNDGSLRLKTQEEIDAEIYESDLLVLKTKLRTKLKGAVGDIQDQHMQTLAFVCALIVYSRQQPQALADFFDQIIPDIKDCFPLNRWEEILKQGGKDLKSAMIEYYAGIDSL
ncbi:MAG: hypothetical protein ACYSSO_11700 [Planctomycetota bacterium]|jgi:hypothetical protein